MYTGGIFLSRFLLRTFPCLFLSLNSDNLYTAHGFDTDKSSAFKLEGCRFREVGSAYASRCMPLASPKR